MIENEKEKEIKRKKRVEKEKWSTKQLRKQLSKMTTTGITEI